MPGWPRLVLLALGMSIAAINGIETSEGTMDFIGGILIFAAWLWPGCDYTTRTRDNSTEYALGRRKIGWVSSAQMDRALRAVDGQSDGLVFRSWSMPFPANWCSVRDYSLDPERFRTTRIDIHTTS